MFNFQTGVCEEVNSADENFPLDGTSSIEIGASKYVDANNCRLDHVSIQVAE